MNWSAIISLIWCNIFQIVVYWIAFECIELHLVGKWSAWRAKPISPCLSVQKSVCPYQGCDFFIFKVLGQKLDLHFLIQVVWIKNWKLKILFFGMNEHEKKLILKQILYMLIHSWDKYSYSGVQQIEAPCYERDHFLCPYMVYATLESFNLKLKLFYLIFI